MQLPLGNRVRLGLTLIVPLAALAACSPAATEAPAEEAAPTVDAAAMATEPMATEVTGPSTYDVQFITHIDNQMPEQDVFLESADDATMAMRVEGAAASDPANLAMNVFAASEAVEHDPFKVTDAPLGPFPKGADLGFTLESWLAAEGTGSYTVDGDAASVDLKFTGLVPNGVYTLWCSRLILPPEPGAVDVACGNEDGSENAFTADADGNGAIALEVTPFLPSTAEEISALAIAYHSDGESHGASPGDFGLNSHVQLFWMLPPDLQ